MTKRCRTSSQSTCPEGAPERPAPLAGRSLVCPRLLKGEQNDDSEAEIAWTVEWPVSTWQISHISDALRPLTALVERRLFYCLQAVAMAPGRICPTGAGDMQEAEMTADQEITHYLEQGHIIVTTQPEVLATVLGSCVAVCLWDEKLVCGGMNHFLYPRAPHKDEATPRFGNAATIALVRMMEDVGCKREHMVAQIFGGGHAEGQDGESSVGAENVLVARTVLEKKSVRVLSSDVGGSMGRKVVFDVATGHAVVLKVHKVRQTDWVEHVPKVS